VFFVGELNPYPCRHVNSVLWHVNSVLWIRNFFADPDLDLEVLDPELRILDPELELNLNTKTYYVIEFTFW
jgi:hypothetical protein